MAAAVSEKNRRKGAHRRVTHAMISHTRAGEISKVVGVGGSRGPKPAARMAGRIG